VVAHGFDRDTIAGLVRSGLATATRESMKAGGKTVEAVRLWIPAAGRKAIEEWSRPAHERNTDVPRAELYRAT
jgi:hypothetical protein